MNFRAIATLVTQSCAPRSSRHGAYIYTTSRACVFQTCSKPPSMEPSRAYISKVKISPNPIPNTQHVTAALEAMECVVVQDLFLNETAKFAHVFLPGCSFLEKDGTFTNAERRISRVRKVMEPKGRYADWEVTQLLANAMGYPMHYSHPSEIMDEIARLTPTFHGVSFDKIEQLGSIQWPCNEQHPDGTPVMHVDEFVRGKGRFMLTEYVPTSEKVNAKHPLILTTGRILSQYNVGAQTRRTANVMWHDEDRLEIHPHDAEERGINEEDWVGIESRAGQTVLRARISERMQPGVVYTTFHFPGSGANVITTENSDWATNCPEYKVTAVQVTRVSQPSEWQRRYQAFSNEQQSLLEQSLDATETPETSIGKGYVTRRVDRYRHGEHEQHNDAITEEMPVAMIYNDVPFAVMMVTPLDLDDFALGFSLSEGLIAKQEELQTIVVSPRWKVSKLVMRVASTTVEDRAGSAANVFCLAAAVADCVVRACWKMLCATPSQWGAGPTIEAAALEHALDSLRDFAAGQCGNGLGTRGSMGWYDGNIVMVREDVGRHNALDKLIGAMVKARIDPQRGFLVVTSRASYEMVTKAASAGITFMAAISAPTALAIHLAENTGLTLVGFARPGSYVVYTHPQRLLHAVGANA